MANIEKNYNHKIFQAILGNQGEIPLQFRQQKLDELMTDLNVQFITRYFFAYLLLDKKRTKLVPTIFKIWNNYMKEKKDIHEASVVSSYELSNQELEIIKEKIKRTVCSENGILNFSYTLDKSLLGGFKVEVDGNVTDLTFLPQVTSWEKYAKDEQAKKEQYISTIPKFLY